MAEKETHPNLATDLRRHAEEIAREKAAQLPESMETLSPEETRQTLHELRIHQIELTMQNDELRRARVELDAAGARYFDFYDLAPVGYFTLNEQGLILEANLTAAAMLDVSRDELIKQPFPRYILKEDADSFYLHRKKLFEKATPQAWEMRMLKKDTTTFWAQMEAIAAKDADGTPVCRIAMSDITVRKQAEKALRESEERFRLLAENARDTIWTMDMNLRITYVSPYIKQILDYTPEEYMIMPLNEVLTPSSLDLCMQLFAEELEIENNEVKDLLRSRTVEVEQIGRNGNVVPAEIKMTFMRNAAGQAIGILGYSNDITERKRAEVEKTKLEFQNRQLQKAESLGKMAAAIAHTFNNQLGAVIGNIEMAIDDLPKESGLFNSLTAAMQAAQKSAEVSGMMLTFLGQSLDNPEILDLSEVCRLNLPIINASLPGNVALETRLPSPGPGILASNNQLHQILMILITNAWEAIGKVGGSIHLNVTIVSPADIAQSHSFPVGWQPKDSVYACLEVADTGDGIAPNDIEKLFDPFFSSKFTGRGLGLSVALGIVKAHSGAVAVESKPGAGSTFRIFLPVSPGEVSKQPFKSTPVTDIAEGETILLVDDEEMVRDMTEAMLKRLGFTVLTAKDGVDAVHLFRQHQNEIRLVLSDLTMPRMDGWETLTALRKLAPDLPAILASGYDKAHAMAGDHPELPQVFLGKPYKLKELRDAISQAWVGKKQ